jgi:hypothetical protein
MIVCDLDYLTSIRLPVGTLTVGGRSFSSNANALALAQTFSGGLPVKEEYSLTLTAISVGPDYASSQAISAAQIINNRLQG